jgi:hypothetical protein
MSKYDFDFHIKADMTPEQFKETTSAAMAKAKEDPDNIVTVYFDPVDFDVLEGDEVVSSYAHKLSGREVYWIRLWTRGDKICKTYAPKPAEKETKNYIEWVW